MHSDKFSQVVFEEKEVFDIMMSDRSGAIKPGPFLLSDNTDISVANDLAGYDAFIKYTESDMDIKEFDRKQQETWFMPQDYKELDIVEYVLDLCEGDQDKLQRCGQELLLYQEKNLFNLLRYLKYLVDMMQLHDIIWGVGRGSSVSSYVLFLLGVHRIDSIYYDLDVTEFLR